MVAGIVVVEHGGDLGTAGDVVCSAGRDEFQVELQHPLVGRFQERLAHGVGESCVRVVFLQGLS